jgi:twitching motility protein PilT
VSLASYLDILRQTHADELLLVPGEPISVTVPGRPPSRAGSPVPAQAILAIAEELLSHDQLRALGQGSQRVDHEHGGTDYVIEVVRHGGGVALALRPARAAVRAQSPASTPRPAAPPAPASAPTPTPAPAPAPASTHARAQAATAHDIPRIEVGRRIDELLREMIAKRASDLHLSADNPPTLRIDGEIRPLSQRGKLSSSEIFAMVVEVMNDRAQKDFAELRDADCAYELPGVARFRVNVFEDRKGTGAVLRQIPIEVIPADKLGLPSACIDLCMLSKGLVVVTGPTGSGKSTTLAAMIDHINKSRTDHIITIEDPVEFVHTNIRCLINQREVGAHTKSFKNALRAALREDPDIVLVGEMRDLETIAIAIETAETGHLVFGTLHTTTATSTVDRIIDQFPADRQAQIRVMLSESLKGVVAQVLCKRIDGGRIAAHEVLLGTPAVGAMIREGKTFQLGNVMQTSKAQGMTTMNDSLFALVQKNLVDPREAWLKAVDKNGLVALYKNVGLPTQFG